MTQEQFDDKYQELTAAAIALGRQATALYNKSLGMAHIVPDAQAVEMATEVKAAKDIQTAKDAIDTAKATLRAAQNAAFDAYNGAKDARQSVKDLEKEFAAQGPGELV